MGKYNIVKSPVQEKDPFGKVVKTTDYWGIFFNYENELREKTSIYLIENTNLLIPLKPDILTPYIGSLKRKN
jgi:hypothetical protein